MVDMARNEEAVCGARMMGGGFGGCSINLVKTENAGAFIEKTSAAYLGAFGKKLKVYPVRLTAGTEVVFSAGKSK